MNSLNNRIFLWLLGISQVACFWPFPCNLPCPKLKVPSAFCTSCVCDDKIKCENIKSKDPVTCECKCFLQDLYAVCGKATDSVDTEECLCYCDKPKRQPKCGPNYGYNYVVNDLCKCECGDKKYCRKGGKVHQFLPQKVNDSIKLHFTILDINPHYLRRDLKTCECICDEPFLEYACTNNVKDSVANVKDCKCGKIAKSNSF